ncbi:MAG TPA: ATP-binding protein [Solirubrobacteraceae bacterium]|nr:ATP-binding protein [Solirubrobacteraceae bacterium]
MEDRSERVLVYRHEAQLVEAAGSFISEALTGGGAAVALASAAHLRALEDWVSLCGSDLGAAAVQHRYRGFEVEAVLDSLDSPADVAPALSAQLAAALAEIPPEVAPVHVFGEVAQALRAAPGDAANVSFAALADELRGARPVSLLCARHEDVTADAACSRQERADGAALLEAPRFPASPASNGAVVSSAVLPPAPAACRAARRLVRAACANEAGADAIGAAELVVSELAGNAVRHARSTFKAEVSFNNGSVRLAVTDARPLPADWDGFPIAREHGLGLVAAMAESWAVEPLADGKVVWAELARNGAVR